MAKRLRQFITLFFSLNQNPSDRQVHALAEALGVDKESLEAVIYKMFGDRQKQQLGAATDEEVLEDKYEENMVGPDQVVMNDGQQDPTGDQMTQDAMQFDGVGPENEYLAPGINTDPVPRFDGVVESAVVNAAFDESKMDELRIIDSLLSREGFKFKEGKGHLYFQTPPKSIGKDCRDAIAILRRAGHKFRVKPDALESDRFAVKCPDGLTLQRLGNTIRLFYSVKAK